VWDTNAVGQQQGNLPDPNGSTLGFSPVDVNLGNKGVDSETSVGTLIAALESSLGPNSFKLIVTALHSMAQSGAFTSISSFLKSLQDAAGTARTNSVIVPAAAGELIPVTDEFGPASLYSPNNPVVVDAPASEEATSATAVPTLGGPTVTSPGNKLGNFVYFTLSDLGSRSQPINCYAFQVVPASNADGSMPKLRLRVPQAGKPPKESDGSPGIIAKYSLDSTTHAFAVGAYATALGDRAARFRVAVRFDSAGACPTP
jgi:hypothetical protein